MNFEVFIMILMQLMVHLNHSLRLESQTIDITYFDYYARGKLSLNYMVTKSFAQIINFDSKGSETN
jgi:hypothetical protein